MTATRFVLKWLAPEFMGHLAEKERERYELATRYIRNAVVKKLGVKYPPPSQRGEPPHLRTGNLRRSISSEVVEESGNHIGRVGTNVVYGKYLELPDVLDRSFLASTLNEEWDTVRAMLIGRKID